jgi:uncharacterized protein YhjY with autotransporter beta-barrel domain
MVEGWSVNPAAAGCVSRSNPGGIFDDCSGARGQDAGTGSNNGDNGTRGGDGTQQTNYGLTAGGLTNNSSTTAAFQMFTSGGDGGNGKDWRSNPNHWGGSGGNAAAIGFTLSAGNTITNRGGTAVSLVANGGNAGAYATEAEYGQGGNGGSVTANLSNLTLNAEGNPGASGLYVSAAGGAGSRAYVATIDHNPPGGHGGLAGTINVTMAGIVHSTGYGILLTATGGQGGQGTGNGNNPSGDGGSGGPVTLNYTSGTIDVTGPQGGIVAVSTGGAGGSAAPGRSTPGGQGAGGGSVSITNNATINVSVNSQGAAAISAQSFGGAGGNGGDGRILGPTGKPGGAGGDGGAVQVTNTGQLSTLANGSIGIVAVSQGGLGGSGGTDHGIIYSHGGKGGSGGAEADVSVTHLGTITTKGDNATGILALSLGGGGAVGGSASGGVVSVGGGGANGGDGGEVNVSTQAGGSVNFPTASSIQTYGKQAYAVEAESTGGGGGNGGRSFAIGALPFTLSVGGSGGDGGNGGQVTVNNSQFLSTSGDQSHAIFAQSAGGGGGNGGIANLASVSAIFNFSLALGGTGGGGGNGGQVTVNNNTLDSSILTTGVGSSGIYAQSIGGGGGNGGSALSDQLTPAAAGAAVAFNMSLGGKSGGGGSGGAVTVSNDGMINTGGMQSPAIFAQSIGGGGGNGGTATVGSIDGAIGSFPWSASIAVGGAGGFGGNGGAVAVTNSGTGTITTASDSSAGIYVQSTGGGGGKGGLASNLGIYNLVDVSIGGKAGGLLQNIKGDDGGAVTVNNAGTIATKGKKSDAIFAESVGGGGGDGGGASGLGIGVVHVAAGGNGGIGGNGGAVSVANDGSLATAGEVSDAVYAHSIGGGGGNATVTQQIAAGAAIDAAVTLGGKGGNGGDGGAVQITSHGTSVTTGDNSLGLFAQSVGGGGGNGGAAWSGQLVAGIPNPSHISSAAFNMALGGSGGTGGNGGTVDVNNGGAVDTSGLQATALFAQSIGDGGGNGGASTAGTVVITPAAGAAPDASFGVSETLAIGGSGGKGGIGGTVTVENTGDVTTMGLGALGIFAQSTGGGGGNGGNSIESAGAISLGPGATPNQPDGGIPQNYSFTLGQSIGGQGGTGGVGGNVTVTNDGSIGTAGDKAIGIFAQSVGGGGGNGGSSQGLASSVPNFTSTTTVGGKGGSGNDGGTVLVTNGTNDPASISTSGNDAAGIFAQSVGGGGGNEGDALNVTGSVFQSAFSDTAALQRLALLIAQNKWSIAKPQIKGSIGVTVGGSGGAAGQGGSVTVNNADSIATHGQQSPGIFAQSVGGGGGKGGSADAMSEAGLVQTIVDGLATLGGSLKKILSPSADLSLTVSVGGSGGAGGNGGSVTVANSGSVSTDQSDSAGILAQSIGGGGGNGGGASKGLGDAAKDLDLSAQQFQRFINVINALPWSGSWTRAFSVGGSGGAAGDGGAITVTNTGGIATAGVNSEGIFAQSVGGGGGNGAHADPLAGAATFALNTEIGGKGGGGGSGGSITVNNSSTIETSGTNSIGVLAQSIGGGGGKSSQTFGGGVSGFNPAWGVNWLSSLGASGASGHGGTVSVTSSGKIATSGALAHGILAQSIGNGGGVSLLTVDNSGITGEPAIPTLSTTNILGAANNSARGDGGNAAVTVSGTVQTSGAAAFGVIAQSIGDGGGYSAIGTSSGLSSSPMTLTLGGGGNATGYGGEADVTVASGGRVVTNGQNAVGVLAQSVGGGGGIAGLSTTSGLVTLGSATGTSYGDGGAVNVTVNGAVQTSGAGAVGVLAQSIGGGGGLAGNLAGVSYGLDLVKDAGVVGSAGQGGAVTVNANGSIVTGGANAPAILAMSIASGAVFTDAGLLLKRPYSTVGNYGGAIDINVGSNAVVKATGANSPAIYAISYGNSGGGNGEIHRGSNIAIDIAQGATVTGGGGDLGTAITAVTPETVTINNAGLISSISGNAITTASAATIVNNAGTILGDVTLGQNSQFNNQSGGIFNSGAIVSLSGGAGTLTNLGTLNPGGAGVFRETHVIGNFAQSGSGVYAADLNFSTHNSDFLWVNGQTTLGGSVLPVVQNPLKGVALGIGHFDHRPEGSWSIPNPSVVFTYNLFNNGPGNQDPLVSVDANFKPSGIPLNGDRAEVAGYLQALWNTGYKEAAPIFNAFTQTGSGTAYNALLNNIANDAAHSWFIRATQDNYAFFNRLMSCPYFVDGGTRLSEGECVWGRVVGSYLDRNGTAQDNGYQSRQMTLQFGAQSEFAKDWFVGGSVSYGSTRTTSSDTAVSAQSFNAGVVLKRELGPWLFAGALKGGYETSDAVRYISLPGLTARARSTPDVFYVGGRLRAAYEVPLNSWYVKPFVDLDINYADQAAYRDTGAGILNLSVAHNSATSVMTTPSVEFGGRINLPNAVLRPYAIAGVSFLSSGDWVSRLRMDSMPDSVAPFMVSTNVPKTYGNFTAGLEMLNDNRFELKAEYGLRGARDYFEQSGTMRFAVHF